jgi:O-antigen ligase
LPKLRQSTKKPSGQFWILAVFLMLLFSTGGASRIDVQSLIILRPSSIIVCALACMTLRREHLARQSGLIWSIGAVFLLALLHLVPLPPSIWQTLPGRQELIDVETLLGMKDVWRPLTLAPMNGRHALLSLFVPLAVILLGIQLSRDDLFRLLPLLIGLASISGLIGLLQSISDPQGALYFYRITNNGSAVGLFANRNHAATLLACLFPMLAVLASTAKGTENQVRFRQLVACAIAIVLVPLILVTGSRSGLISSLIGLAAAGLLYRRSAEGRGVGLRKSSRIRAAPLLGALAVACLGFITFLFARAEAIDRFFNGTVGEDGRTDFGMVAFSLIWKYFPVGSGAGSFVEVFQIDEPTRILDPTYLNRAHNDWVETAMTFGLPGMIALMIAVVGYVARSYHFWRKADGSQRSVAFGRMASVVMLIISIASLSDYPLRTPIMMGVFAIFALWLNEVGREPPSGASAGDGKY